METLLNLRLVLSILAQVMKNYELTLILEGKVTSAKKKAVLESLEKIVKLFKGQMDKVEDWGVKEMFHEIKKNKEGAYLHIPLEFEPSSLKSLEVKLKAEENILRY